MNWTPSESVNLHTREVSMGQWGRIKVLPMICHLLWMQQCDNYRPPERLSEISCIMDRDSRDQELQTEQNCSWEGIQKDHSPGS